MMQWDGENRYKVFYKLILQKYYITQNNFWRMWVTRQLTVAIDFHSIFSHTMEVNGYRQP